MEDDTVPILDAFHLLLSLIRSSGNNICLNSTSDFLEGAHNTEYPSNPIRYTASPSNADRHLEYLTATYFVFYRTFLLHIVVSNPFLIARNRFTKEMDRLF